MDCLKSIEEVESLKEFLEMTDSEYEVAKQKMLDEIPLIIERETNQPCERDINKLSQEMAEYEIRTMRAERNLPDDVELIIEPDPYCEQLMELMAVIKKIKSAEIDEIEDEDELKFEELIKNIGTNFLPKQTETPSPNPGPEPSFSGVEREVDKKRKRTCSTSETEASSVRNKEKDENKYENLIPLNLVKVREISDVQTSSQLTSSLLSTSSQNISPNVVLGKHCDTVPVRPTSPQPGPSHIDWSQMPKAQSGKRKSPFDSHAKTKRSKLSPATSQEAKLHRQNLTSDDPNQPSTSGLQYAKSINIYTPKLRNRRVKNCFMCPNEQCGPHPPALRDTRRQRAIRINDRMNQQNEQENNVNPENNPNSKESFLRAFELTSVQR